MVMLYDFHCHYKNNIVFESDIKTIFIVDFMDLSVIDVSQCKKFFVGIHPEKLENLTYVDLDIIFSGLEQEVKKNNKIIGIGEIGLDKRFPDKSKQIYAFRNQLKIASLYNIPVQIHNVKSNNEIFNIIKDFKDLIFILHSYKGSKELTRIWMEYNSFFSISPYSIKSNKLMQQLDFIKNRIVVESDSDSTDKYKIRRINLEQIIKQIIKNSFINRKELFDILCKNYNKIIN